jgi:hypothetical protein
MGKSIDEQRASIRDKGKKQTKLEKYRNRVENNRYYSNTMFVRGLYKLYYNNQVVYVGMSKTNVFNRITDHFNDEDKIFDSFSFKSYLDLSDRALEQIEADVIKKLRPKYNKTHNNDRNLKEIPYVYKKLPKSRFNTETKSLKYSETISGKRIYDK